MIDLRLKRIEQDVDFRKNELTTYRLFKEKNKNYPDPMPGEAYLFVSKSGNQLMFVLNYKKDIKLHKSKRDIIESLRLRLSGGRWNPLMLANYAEEVGVKLLGIRKYEEIFEEQKETKRKVPVTRKKAA